MDRVAIKKFPKLSHLPFQVQIEYTRIDGARCVRVITHLKKVTRDKQEANKNINVGIVGAASAQKSAMYCQAVIKKNLKK